MESSLNSLPVVLPVVTDHYLLGMEAIAGYKWYFILFFLMDRLQSKHFLHY